MFRKYIFNLLIIYLMSLTPSNKNINSKKLSQTGWECASSGWHRPYPIIGSTKPSIVLQGQYLNRISIQIYMHSIDNVVNFQIGLCLCHD